MDMGINMKMSKKFLAGALIFSACSALSTVAQG
ncbi:fimbrial protein, partial [Klebsiella pneumoniae]